MNAPLLELINPQPNCKVLAVIPATNAQLAEMAAYLNTFGAELHVALYGDAEVEGAENVRSHRVSGFDKPFRALPREYQNVFFFGMLSAHRFPERMLKLAYTSLVNAGELILVEPALAQERYALEALMERCEYRAFNRIEMLEGHDVFVGKKMHMWGNGL